MIYKYRYRYSNTNIDIAIYSDIYCTRPIKIMAEPKGNIFYCSVYISSTRSWSVIVPFNTVVFTEEQNIRRQTP